MKSRLWLLFPLCSLATANVLVDRAGDPVTDTSSSGPSLSLSFSQHTSTSTTTSAGSTQTLTIAFAQPDTLIGCSIATLTWSYFGPTDGGITMDIDITDKDVVQVSSSSSSDSNTGTDITPRAVPTGLTETFIWSSVVQGIDPFKLTYTWPQVTVPQGYYIFQAGINGYLTPSPAFFVQNGTNMSCIEGSGQPHTSTYTTTLGTSTLASSSSASQSGTGSGNDTTLPVGGTSSSHINKGALAGGIVGGLAVVAAVVAAFLFIRYSSNSSYATHRRNIKNGSSGGGGMGIMGRWGNLGSFDSATGKSPSSSDPAKTSKAKAKFYNASAGNVGLTGLGLSSSSAGGNQRKSTSRHNSQTDSVGPIMHLGRHYRTTPGAGDSQEDMENYTYSSSHDDDEKYMRSPFSDPGHSSSTEEGMGMIPIGYDPSPIPSSAGATGGHGSNGTKHSSIASSTFSFSQPYVVQNNSYTRPRSQSSRPAYSPSPQTFPESPRNTSSATIESQQSNPAHVRRASSPVILTESSTLTPSSPLIPITAGLTGVGAFGIDTGSGGTTSSQPPTPPTPITPARKTPRKPVPTYDPQDPSFLPSQSQHDGFPIDVVAEDLELQHKASFGSLYGGGGGGSGKNEVHYLMPDLPPPQKD